MNKNLFKDNQNLGFTTMYVILILSIFGFTMMTLGSLFLFQVRSVTNEGYSLKAFFIAESGLEDASSKFFKGNPLVFSPAVFTGTTTGDGSSYQVFVEDKGSMYIFTSIGKFQNFVRTVEIDYNK